MNLNFPPSFFFQFYFDFSLFSLQIVSDSLKEISEKQKDLKKKLKVSFVGEPGLGTKIIFNALKRYVKKKTNQYQIENYPDYLFSFQIWEVWPNNGFSYWWNKYLNQIMACLCTIQILDVIGLAFRDPIRILENIT